jgi:hypothetical protein
VNLKELSKTELTKQIAKLQKQQENDKLPAWATKHLNNLLREQERRDMTEWITERMHELPKGSLHKATGTPRGKKISKTALITLIKTTKDKALRARAAICLQRHHGVSV